jgi:hypothetical protein
MMSMDYIRRQYGVPAKRGARVRYTGGLSPAEGRITSARGPHIRVRLDGEKRSDVYHPTWKIEYLDAPLLARLRAA